MTFHLLALKLTALMIGAPAAFLLGSVLLFIQGSLLFGIAYSEIFAFNALFLLLPSCIINSGLRYLTLRFLPRQLFVYIFKTGTEAPEIYFISTKNLSGIVYK